MCLSGTNLLKVNENIICKRCGSINDYYVVKTGPHKKAICNNCGIYIKFTKQSTLPEEQPASKTMSTLITGSICFTDLMEKAKAGHSAFSRAKNGKVYFNFTEWINDEADQYGNHASLLLNSTKEKKEVEGKFYFGNGKIFNNLPPSPPELPVQNEPLDDLPF